MNNPTPWFERTFEFNAPLDSFPELCTRLRTLPPALEDLVARAPRETLIRRKGGHWSIQENAGHLLDLEPLWSERVDDFLTGSRQLTVADLRNEKTHRANHNERDMSVILVALRTIRLHLVDRIQGFSAAVLSRTLDHPRLRQPMRLFDHLYFVAEHDEHHLSTIRALLSD